MTREEARKFLIDISYSLGNMSIEYLSEKDGEKMRDAIKVLEQEQCEDAISRSEAIRVASGYCHFSNIPAELAKLPSVNPQKTGHWYKSDGIEPIGWYCSECGLYSAAHYRPNYKYCQNCGAKMEGVE